MEGSGVMLSCSKAVELLDWGILEENSLTSLRVLYKSLLKVNGTLSSTLVLL